NNGQDSLFAIYAEKFALIADQNGRTTLPFIIGPVGQNGEYTVGIDGGLVVRDTIKSWHVHAEAFTGREFSAQARFVLGNGGRLYAGAGNILLDTGGNHGRMIIAQDGGVNEDGQINAGRNYMLLDAGDITFYRWVNGQHIPYKSLTKVLHGVATNGADVDLGYWAVAPRVVCSPSSLQCYNPQAKEQRQYFNLSFNLIDRGGGMYTLRPTATLTTDPGSGSANLGLGSGNQLDNVGYSTGGWQSPDYVASIKVRVRLRSVKNAGQPNLFNYRRVQWRAVVDGTPTIYKTVDIGASTAEVADEVTISGLAAGAHSVYVESFAYDAGGTFSTGATEYEYSTASNSRAQNRMTSVAVNVPNGPKTTDSANASVAYDEPTVYYDPSWEVTGSSIVLNYDWYLTATKQGVAWATASAMGHMISAPGTAGSNENGPPGSVAVQASGSQFDGSGASATVTVKLCTKTLQLRRVKSSPTAIDNGTTFEYAEYSLASGTVLAAGTVAYIAVGE
ncbi:MAG TPA: hypothetical protein VNT26_14730, partial [Candidatus Sulfotelmatobacter sp.]|nr:hypothetical protein [Candidatus Sulfotelmatobacter sp.]